LNSNDKENHDTVDEQMKGPEDFFFFQILMKTDCILSIVRFGKTLGSLSSSASPACNKKDNWHRGKAQCRTSREKEFRNPMTTGRKLINPSPLHPSPG
jgi:hypothetical protein